MAAQQDNGLAAGSLDSGVRRTWIASLVLLTASLLLLTLLVRAYPESEIELRLLDWFSGWDVPVLQGWLDGVSSAAGQWPTVLTAGVALILAILLSGPNKGIALGVTFGIIGTADLIVGETLARIVGRIRPNEDPGSISFPSGHVAFVTSAATLLVYVAANHRIRRPWVLFLALVLGFFAVSVGISRVNQLAHWPSDVLGGYLLGFIRPLLLIPVYHRMEQVRWVTPPRVWYKRARTRRQRRHR